MNDAWVENTTSDRGENTELQTLHGEFLVAWFSVVSSTAMQ